MPETTTIKTPNKSTNWFGDKIGKPFAWFALGFVTCKVLEAYTENKKVKRLSI